MSPLGVPAIARAAECSEWAVRKRLQRRRVPHLLGRARSRGREKLYRPADLPSDLRAAVERAASGPARLEAEWAEAESSRCAHCYKRIANPDRSCACSRCDGAAHAGCMDGDLCIRCRRAQRNWRKRYRAALDRGAAALDASRAARGECPAAELAERWEGQ